MKQLLSVSAVFLLLIAVQASAGQDADLAKARAYYKGKTITWMIGSTPGGSVDQLSRLVGPFLAKHTGARVILQNRPGGGGTFAFNYLYSKAKRNGLTLAFHIGSTQALNIVSDQPGIHFKFPELSFIGVVTPVVNTMMANAKKFKTLEDLKRAKNIRYGMTRPGGNVHFVGIAMQKILGLNLQFVPGYSGSNEVRQALLSGEVDVAVYPASEYVSAIQDGLVVPIVTNGQRRHPAVPDTPTLQEIVGKIPPPFDSWIDIARVGWSLYGPPKLPPDRLQFLRVALKEAVHDPELLKLAKRRDMLIDYMDPEQALQIVNNFLNMPEKDKAELKRLMKRR